MFFLKELPTQTMLENYRARFPMMNTPVVKEALHMLRRASLLLREMENYFAAHELSQLRFLILIVLDREHDSEGLMVSEVADRIDVSRPVMTRTLQTLVQDGFLEISADKEDGRSKRVRLTSSGQKKLLSVLPGYYQIIEAFMSAK